MTEQLQTKLERIKAECRKAIELGEAATAGPWHKCSASDGRCRCGQIWSIPADSPVCECNSKWGDGAEGTETWFEYGDIGETAKQANKDFIAWARTFSPAAAKALLTAIEALEEVDSAFAYCSYTKEAMEKISQQWPE